MGSIDLKENFLQHFKIKDYKQAAPGGQKTVFIVEIEDKKFALKIIHFADERLEREIKICKEFNHVIGIPSILRIEEFNGDTVILEEYIEGNDLSELMESYLGNERKVLSLIYQIGLVLQPVWEERYVHRDLKPQNIRIRKDGSPVVLDFGIARALDDETITAAGSQPLSWFYASPEQYEGKKALISYRTDFFCLGILAYRLYSGKLPFGNNKEEISNTFSKPLTQCSSGNNFIDVFCSAMFHINPSARTRKIETFLKLAAI